MAVAAHAGVGGCNIPYMKKQLDLFDSVAGYAHKIVYFKIEGDKRGMARYGPALNTDTETTVLERLARVFNVDISKIKILELK